MANALSNQVSAEFLRQMKMAKEGTWTLPDPLPAMFLDDVDLTVSTPLADLRTTLNAFPLESLKQLAAAVGAGRVIRKQYTDVHGNGCLLNCLDPAINSKPALLSYDRFDEDTLAAARRVVRHWDNTSISIDEVREVVAEVIEHRIQVNAAEDAMVDATRLAAVGAGAAE